MRAIDTNVLVRLIVRDDVQQLGRAEEFIAQGAWASHIVLADTAWVLDSNYGLSPGQIATTVEMLLSNGAISFQEPEVIEAALATFRRHPKVGFSDCLVAEIARKSGHTPLGTFDKRLARLEGAQQL